MRVFYYSTEAHGYKRDPCLFVKLDNGERTYVWIHVDDTFAASTTKQGLQEFERIIGLRYKYTVQHDIESFLGVHISKLPDGKSVKLTQPKLLSARHLSCSRTSKQHRSFLLGFDTYWQNCIPASPRCSTVRHKVTTRHCDCCLFRCDSCGNSYTRCLPGAASLCTIPLEYTRSRTRASPWHSRR